VCRKKSFLSHRVRIPNRPACTDHVIPDPTLLQITDFNYLWSFWLCGFWSWKHLLETTVLSQISAICSWSVNLSPISLATSVLTFGRLLVQFIVISAAQLFAVCRIVKALLLSLRSVVQFV
jgi:hypothetical protein